jgi:membrane fusion protein, copper/silver efflux system
MLHFQRPSCRYSCLIVLGLLACQGESATQPQTASAQSATAKPGTPAQNLVNAYIQLQTKLAKDDAAGAKSAFARVQAAVKAEGLGIDPALQKRIDGAAAQGAAASNIAGARSAFAALSDAFLALYKTTENPLADSLTVASCPMALDNKGAKWLQLGEKIQNPYFGSEMLTCGSVDGAVKPGKRL